MSRYRRRATGGTGQLLAWTHVARVVVALSIVGVAACPGVGAQVPLLPAWLLPAPPARHAAEACTIGLMGPSTEQLVNRATRCTQEVADYCGLEGIFFVVLHCNCVASGGPEAYHQLHHALVNLGKCSLMYGAIQIYQTPHSRFVNGPADQMLLPSPLQLQPGDTVIISDGAPPPSPQIKAWRERGVFVVAWLVGQTSADLSVALNPMALHLCLDHYFGQVYHCLPRAQLSVPMSARFHDQAVVLRHHPKENLVLLDNDNSHNPVRMEELQALAPDIEFVVLQGYTRDEVVDLYSRAKLAIDLYVPGAERMVFEASLFGCMVGVAANGNGRDRYDFPVPAKAILPAVPTSADVVRMAREYLPRYPAALIEWEAFHTVAKSSKDQEFIAAVDGYFGTSVVFVSAAPQVGGGDADHLGFLVMTLIQFPFASVELAVPDVEQFTFQNAAILHVLKQWGHTNNVHIGGPWSAGEDRAIAGPRRKVVCVATTAPLSIVRGRGYLGDIMAELEAAAKGQPGPNGEVLVLSVGGGVFCMTQATFQRLGSQRVLDGHGWLHLGAGVKSAVREVRVAAQGGMVRARLRRPASEGRAVPMSVFDKESIGDLAGTSAWHDIDTLLPVPLAAPYNGCGAIPVELRVGMAVFAAIAVAAAAGVWWRTSAAQRVRLCMSRASRSCGNRFFGNHGNQPTRARKQIV